MSYVFVGLGNPGEEYKETRHNTGRMLLESFGKSVGAQWKEDKKLNSLVSKAKIGKTPVTLLLPNTFMNNSGKAVKSLVTSQKAGEKTVVIYDDLDLPFGTVKISFNKSSGGHKGLESIIKALKTEKFVRIRVGISPVTSSGKIKKPKGVRSRGATSQDLVRLFQSKANEKGDKVYSSGTEDAVIKLIMGKWKESELPTLKKLSKKINSALETFGKSTSFSLSSSGKLKTLVWLISSGSIPKVKGASCGRVELLIGKISSLGL